jgi:ribosomal protein L34E
MSETPDLRWFEQFPKCQGCGRTATGLLRGVRNDSYGYHCTRCAERRLKASAKARERERAL